MNHSPRPPCGAPKMGPRAHNLSRELEFDRPAQVGATPFWDRRRAPSGTENKGPQCEPLT